MLELYDPHPERNAKWPAPDTVWSDLEAMHAHLRIAVPNVVHIPTKRLRETSVTPWLIGRLGPPMVTSRYDPTTDKTAQYWTHGIWLGVSVAIRPEQGRNFYFVNPDDAFEFKIRWG